MEVEPDLPVPISAIDGKYLLFDIDAISWLRKHHQICGVFIGTLPQNPSQNIFLGLPMQIMPEEAQLLLDLGVAYLLDDVRAHDKALAKANRKKQREYLANIQQQGQDISESKAKEKEAERARILKHHGQRQGKKKKDRTNIAAAPAPLASSSSVPTTTTSAHSPHHIRDEEETSTSLFAVSDNADKSQLSESPSTQNTPGVETTITPTTSARLLDLSSSPFTSTRKSMTGSLLPNLDSTTYSLYRNLHLRHLSQDQDTSPPLGSARYFATPGLRFGCQFCIYPGDPLRFHSHFLGVGLGWDEEIDLMDIVSGGRLGTAVKKGWLIGGMELDDGLAGNLKGQGKMRTFSVEWAGM